MSPAKPSTSCFVRRMPCACVALQFTKEILYTLVHLLLTARRGSLSFPRVTEEETGERCERAYSRSGHTAEKVAEPDPKLGPADKAPLWPFSPSMDLCIPSSFPSPSLGQTRLFWAFSPGWFYPALSLTPCDTSIIVITPAPGESHAGIMEQCMPRCGLIWDSCSLSEAGEGAEGGVGERPLLPPQT